MLACNPITQEVEEGGSEVHYIGSGTRKGCSYGCLGRLLKPIHLKLAWAEERDSYARGYT